MPEYAFLVGDLRPGGGILGELPGMQQVTAELRLSGAGQFRGAMPAASISAATLAFLNSWEVGRVALWVERDGVVVWGGVVWSCDYNTDTHAIDVGANEFLSYYARRFITDTLVYPQWDQMDIAIHLIAYAEGIGAVYGMPAGHGPGLGTLYPAIASQQSGILRDRTYPAGQMAAVDKSVTDLAAVTSGFEFSIDARTEGPARVKRLILGYPRLGIPAVRNIVSDAGDIIGSTTSPYVFDNPEGNIVRYHWPLEGATRSDEVWAFGAGDSTSQLTVVSRNSVPIAAGYPLLQSQFTRRDISVPATLQGAADAELALSSAPRGVPVVTVRGDVDPVVGTYHVGDDIWLRLRDERYPLTDVAFRLVGYTIRPPDSARGEEVDFALGPQALIGQVPHPDDLARLHLELRERIRWLEQTTASITVRDDIASLKTTVAAVIVAAAPAVPPPPPPLPLPAKIASAIVGYSPFNEGQYRLQPFSFVVPPGSHSISIIGTLVVQTKYWYLNNRADAWLEIPNVVASGNARITGGPYNSVRTASLRIDTTLNGGTYQVDWGMLLQSGNRVQIQGGTIDVWQNT